MNRIRSLLRSLRDWWTEGCLLNIQVSHVSGEYAEFEDCPPGCTKPCCTPSDKTRAALDSLDRNADGGDLR